MSSNRGRSSGASWLRFFLFSHVVVSRFRHLRQKNMSLYPELPEILVSRDSQDSRIAIVSLNRPPQRNAFTGEMKDSLVEAFGRLDRDDSVKVLILKGEENPGKAFCAG